MADHFKSSLESLGKVSALYTEAIRGLSFSYSVTSREHKLIISVYFIG